MPATVSTPTLRGAADRTYPGQGLKRRWRRTQFVIRAAMAGSTSRQWLSILGNDYTDALWRLRPRLGRKLQRGYLHREWSQAQAFAALSSHYNQLPSLVTHEHAQRLYAEGVELVRLKVADGTRHFFLRLGYSDQFDRAGEMTLSLVDGETKSPLASVTFTLIEKNGIRSLWIGAVNCGADAWVRALCKIAIRELYGLRPKAFILWALRELATAWDVSRLTAIADGFSASPSLRKRQKQLGGDNALWQALGGSLQAGGTWELSLENESDPSQERSLAKRKVLEARAGLLQAVQPHFLTAVSDLNRDGPLETRAVAIAGTGAAVSPFSELAAAV